MSTSQTRNFRIADCHTASDSDDYRDKLDEYFEYLFMTDGISEQVFFANVRLRARQRHRRTTTFLCLLAGGTAKTTAFWTLRREISGSEHTSRTPQLAALECILDFA